MTGESSCLLWETIKQLCQTGSEREFLQTYLRYVKDQQFPMLIPQARIGIAERRRPDFVSFVPLQFWKYKWFAIELDGAHSSHQAQTDAARDEEIAAYGYEVISLRPADKGYFEEARRLVERFEILMNLAKSRAHRWQIAVEGKVIRTDEAVPY
jgi:Protein of unknown function (DUF559)